jgi:Flp pilus assembly pilin Flp
MMRWMRARFQSGPASRLTSVSRASRTPRARRSRGAVMVEYALLLVAVGIPAIAGLSAGGLATYNTYVRARNTMLLPIP